MKGGSEIRIASFFPGQSRKLGHFLGSRLEPPSVIALKGDLGSGKTVFVQGLARGLGVPERYPITSPTYTLINVYQGRTPFYHVDLYRIHGTEELEDIGFYEAAGSEGVAAVEWADRLPEGALDEDITIHIELTGDDSRTYRFLFYGRRFDNLVGELKKLQTT
jgi:tRNA threonylcarbamoyladenosine biosynthesis protein TsaE